MRVEQQPTLLLVVLPNVSLRNSTLWSAPLKIMTSSIKCLSLSNMADVTHSKSLLSPDLFLLFWPKVDIPQHITQTWTNTNDLATFKHILGVMVQSSRTVTVIYFFTGLDFLLELIWLMIIKCWNRVHVQYVCLSVWVSSVTLLAP